MNSDTNSEGSIQSTTIKRLIQQSKIKDLALQKATKLIELLTIELQTQKQSKDIQLRELKQKYDITISSLSQKINALQQKLSTNTNFSDQHQGQKKDINQNSLLSVGSSISKRNLAINKKYLLTGNTLVPEPSIIRLDQILLYEEISKIEEIQTEVFGELEDMVEEQHIELDKTNNQLQYCAQIFDGVFEALPECLHSKRMEELRQVTQYQQEIINQMRIYIQELEDSYQAVLHRLSQSQFNHSRLENFRGIDKVVLQVKERIVWAWKQQRLQWCFENGELRNILQKLIELVQGSRHSDFQCYSL